MKYELNKLLQLFIFFLRALVTFKKKIILFSIPTHPNLGDQAQLMCTEKWIAENYKGYKFFSLSHICVPFQNDVRTLFINYSFWCYIVLKITVRKNDVFVGHSGYFFVDHHGGWYTYDFIVKNWGNKFIILPQTINFYTPYVRRVVSKSFGNKDNLTILCRDKVSYENGKELFGTTKLLLYPDIVTSLIGTNSFSNDREGVLFCMRDDLEAFYKPNLIDELMKKFGNIRKERIDTTLKVSKREIKLHRDRLILSMIEKISTYKVVITDRYHGTIFSAIANTPVIVLNSADHKLSSGVSWFPREVYGTNVQFAESLDMAFSLAQDRLNSNEVLINPPSFKENYWDVLYQKLS